MVAESAPALVVVGESDGAAAALLSTLVHGARGGSEGANEASSDDLEGPGPHALRLDTKYYTVDVAATVHTLPDESSTGDGNTHGECPEAVVAVFDPTKDGSFAKITKWCQARDPSWSPEIRLLVCRYPTKDAMDAEASSSADKADDWAVENGYEAVAVIASGGAADETLELRGDAQGTRRVRAALEAHMWPGLTMKRGDEASTFGPLEEGGGRWDYRGRGRDARRSGRRLREDAGGDDPGAGNGSERVGFREARDGRRRGDDDDEQVRHLRVRRR